MLTDLTIAQCGSVSAPFLSEGDQLSQVATSGIPSNSWIVITSPEQAKSSVGATTVSSQPFLNQVLVL
ncbi:hypothetical protein AG0111_0g8051 [Alternaria gaisen]|uniref:Uncharacterized protein n=1 Tax=Alternaria gaisen TaxID=167740 RepID=A0ACB6FFE5_9PLEO|nr:hypothetical protein AG0111_0g8051 [Alternaria gaisen]